VTENTQQIISFTRAAKYVFWVIFLNAQLWLKRNEFSF